MSLSLPLPKQHEVAVNIVVLRRLPRLRLGQVDADRGSLRLSSSELDERVESLRSQHRYLLLSSNLQYPLLLVGISSILSVDCFVALCA